MNILLASLILNEIEHLPYLYKQHRDWPGLARWIFVEAADRIFAETNPDRVSPSGLSVDGTTEFLRRLAAIDPRVTYIPHGFCEHMHDPAQGKVTARQRYLDEAEKVRPDFVFVLDADEFHTRQAQAEISRLLREAGAYRMHRTSHKPRHHAFIFRQRHIWRPASIADQPLFSWEVRGGYWDVPHCRGWRWEPGMRYCRNHNWPEDRYGTLLTMKGLIMRFDQRPDSPECVHLGYASSLASRAAKHRYYVARGEGKEGGRVGRMRGMYVACRSAFETWKPGDTLPHGAKIVQYKGPVPEVFQECQ